MASLHMSRITIGRQIRLRRKDLDISQTNLAKAAGLGRHTIAKIESGRASLPFESAPAVAQMLQLESPMVLFEDVFEGWG